MTFVPDQRFTFGTFVAGPGTSVAAAAAQHAAESPGTSYNPLYLYGSAGVGKTHLLRAVGALARSVRPEMVVLYQTADELVDTLTRAVAGGALESWRDGYLRVGLLLLDDVHRLEGKARTQEELLWLLDEVVRGGTQIVLTGDRPPAEIPGLSDALRARLAGGLSLDLAPPEPEVRLELVRRRAGHARIALGEGVPEMLAELPVHSVPELFQALDRVAEHQRSTGRVLAAAAARRLLAPASAPAVPDEFHAFLLDITSTVEQLVEAAPWRRALAEAILRWEGEGIRTRRLEDALETDSAPDVAALTESFAADVERLRALQRDIGALDETAAANPILRDPGCIAEAEALLASLRTEADRRAASRTVAPEAAPSIDRWFLAREKLAWQWVALDERLIEELG